MDNNSHQSSVELKRDEQEKLAQFDRDAAQLLITLECTAGESHWITLLYRNTLSRIRKVLVRELHA